MTSTETLKLLFPASLEIEPPTDSSSLAICSAVRVLVPFKSTFAIKRVMPLSCVVSASNHEKPRPFPRAAIDDLPARAIATHWRARIFESHQQQPVSLAQLCR